MKAFNVAEAGVDAGMLALKTGWPEQSGETAAVSGSAMRGEFSTTDFRNPSRSAASTFSTVSVYDDRPGRGRTRRTPTTHNGNNLMWVDSSANVDDDRHRILVLAERHTWNLSFPFIAMYAATVGANGRGLRVAVDPAGHVSTPDDRCERGRFAPAYYSTWWAGTSACCPASLDNPERPGDVRAVGHAGPLRSPQGHRPEHGTRTSRPPTPQRPTWRPPAPGRSSTSSPLTAVTLSGTHQIGTSERPCILILDTPEDSDECARLPRHGGLLWRRHLARQRHRAGDHQLLGVVHHRGRAEPATATAPAPRSTTTATSSASSTASTPSA